MFLLSEYEISWEHFRVYSRTILCLVWSCHYTTGYFVTFLSDISIFKSGWNMKKIFCCPALELFHCLPPLFCCLHLWTTVRLHGKKLQNATNYSVFLKIQYAATVNCADLIINTEHEDNWIGVAKMKTKKLFTCTRFKCHIPTCIAVE